MGLIQNLGLLESQDIIENLSKMDLTADIAQIKKSCLMSDLKLSHILPYIKYRKINVSN